ncbi:hypothetical protein FKG94_03855 [Exilibacterium tricleocarpae]|uniref:histidine kinase n=1 Tax=Exilibacterium tricleocarpae TaxID=2591008 RepID=A0A545U5C8_9GAMM|nr:ATP-binding protein [Exilibacterium tricleocarpae]TQV84667.1 hypothetical protein FKG94_03855 [Exilibacterium tricleocarpae]
MFDLTPRQAEEIRHQQVRILYDRFPQALIATVINSGLISVALWQVIAHPVLIGWLLGLLATTLLRLLLYLQYKKQQPAASAAVVWERRFLIGVIASAVIWSSAGVLLFAQHSVLHQVFLAFVVGGMSVGSVTSLSSRWPMALLFILLATTPISIQFLNTDDRVLIVMGFIYAIFFLLILRLARDFHLNTKENITLQVLSTDRARQLEVAKQNAEEASQAKSTFLSQMSHEFRTPLNAIMGFAQIIQLAAADDEKQRARRERAAKEILVAGEYLERLIEDVLDLAAVEKHRIKVQLEPVEACALVQECAGLLAPLAEEHGVTLIVNECPGVVMADPTRARQILLNLIINAIQYNRDQGSVTLHTHFLADKKIRFSVADNGPGIEAAAQDNLFESFQHLGKSGAKSIGIGLTIAKSLTELMHGSIGVDSTEGRGSTFWIDLPSASIDY